MNYLLGFCAFIAVGLFWCDSTSGQVCGNGVREGGEQCDDGNRASFDGCSSRCRFEQVQRANHLQLQFATDTVCTQNKLGGAFGSLIQSTIQNSTEQGVADGSISLLFYFESLDDLSGVTDAEFQLGVFIAAPTSIDASYDGNSDLDWWYLIDDTELVPPQTPAQLLNAHLIAKSMTTDPGSMTLYAILGNPIEMSMSSVRISANTSAVDTPMTWVDGTDRGHLPAENLDPLLQSFGAMGDSSGTPVGKLCGNTSASSLAQVLVPSNIYLQCAGYDSTNTMLDLIVAGCKILTFTAVVATQPDQGGGHAYQFNTDSTHHVVSCTKDGVSDSLSDCLDSASYSTYFRFSTDRVIAKSASAPDFIFYDEFE